MEGFTFLVFLLMHALVCEWMPFSLLSVKGSKTKVIPNKDKPWIPNNNELLEVTSKKSKKHLRTCSAKEESNLDSWEVPVHHFGDAIVALWGGKSTYKELEPNVQDLFITNFLHLVELLFHCKHVMVRGVECMLIIKTTLPSLCGIAWEVDTLGQKARETQKFEFWMDQGEMLIDSIRYTSFMLPWYIPQWNDCLHATSRFGKFWRFTLQKYITCLAQNYKNISRFEHVNAYSYLHTLYLI